MSKKLKLKYKVVLTFVCAITLVILSGSIINHIYFSKFDSLPERDRKIIEETCAFYKGSTKDSVWGNGYPSNASLLAVNGRLGPAYLFNPTESIKSPFATKISVAGYEDIDVYRISRVAPELIKFRGLGNFNIYNKEYELYGNKVFYLRYSEANVFDSGYDSLHYITFMSHEAFHSLVQSKWSNDNVGGRLNTDNLDDGDLDLLESELKTLAAMQIEMNSNKPNKKHLESLLHDYIKIKKSRLKKNPSYVKEEILTETFEGTAEYVSIKASKLADYDYELMTFMSNSGKVIIRFDSIIPSIKNGDTDKSVLSTNIVYCSGALLCMVLDELEHDTWQELVASSRTNKIITLYDVINEFLSE